MANMEFSESQRAAFHQLIVEAMAERGWKQKHLAEAADVNESLIGMFIRSISERISISTFVPLVLALDIPLLEAARVLGLDRQIRQNIENGQQHLYPNYLAEVATLSPEDGEKPGELDELLRNVPADRRELCKKAIYAVVESFKQ
ncbi:helix-turn-helix transcriptional regulator [Dictyobacter kobayashii]|uniref:HTH cro/C1-type domain-containing protein n=1 Tax=Dictyobacter kobayashii TaxID=2014872 RepID=A0A402AYJ4_9CHLR|nr:helix-turn-helix transcriptional regulator [Dictyobacter kobayashii]GCE24133.1 hypothetical protein KDK_79330 [Dictyobacter kobayashii]